VEPSLPHNPRTRAGSGRSGGRGRRGAAVVIKPRSVGVSPPLPGPGSVEGFGEVVANSRRTGRARRPSGADQRPRHADGPGEEATSTTWPSDRSGRSRTAVRDRPGPGPGREVQWSRQRSSRSFPDVRRPGRLRRTRRPSPLAPEPVVPRRDPGRRAHGERDSGGRGGPGGRGRPRPSRPWAARASATPTGRAGVRVGGDDGSEKSAACPAGSRVRGRRTRHLPAAAAVRTPALKVGRRAWPGPRQSSHPRHAGASGAVPRAARLAASVSQSSRSRSSAQVLSNRWRGTGRSGRAAISARSGS